MYGSAGLLALKKEIDLLSDQVDDMRRRVDAICEHLDVELEHEREKYEVTEGEEEDEEGEGEEAVEYVE